MLFNSFSYIVLFLPAVFTIYFLLAKLYKGRAAQWWLVIASLFFYAYWDIRFLPLLLLSILINFFLGRYLHRAKQQGAPGRWIFIAGLIFNIGLLLIFKYTNFFIENANFLTGSHLSLFTLILPLGISFFTFTQIAYLADVYAGKAVSTDIADYSLFVTFFPHLLAGPIIHHSKIMPQFREPENHLVQPSNIRTGLFLFFSGLAKKVVIADFFAKWADAGFGTVAPLGTTACWVAILSYTVQIYFDFSGYSDMAVGAALFFNIKLPINFNSPYKALNIQDFWRRWHITLGSFLREYIYIPLGGSRKSNRTTYRNLFLVFLIGGLWHGAGWTFVIWGALHGAAMVVHRFWSKAGYKLPTPLAWFSTFLFINITWVFFRSGSLTQALIMLRSLFTFTPSPTAFSWTIVAALCGIFAFILLLKNSNYYAEKFRPSLIGTVYLYALFFIGFYFLNNFSQFIYFNF